MPGTPTDRLEFAPKIVSTIGGIVGMTGGIMGILGSRSIRKRDRAARQEYDDLWNTYVAIIEITNSVSPNGVVTKPSMWTGQVQSLCLRGSGYFFSLAYLQRASCRRQGRDHASLCHTQEIRQGFNGLTD